MYKSLMNLDS